MAWYDGLMPSSGAIPAGPGSYIDPLTGRLMSNGAPVEQPAGPQSNPPLAQAPAQMPTYDIPQGGYTPADVTPLQDSFAGRTATGLNDAASYLRNQTGNLGAGAESQVSRSVDPANSYGSAPPEQAQPPAAPGAPPPVPDQAPLPTRPDIPNPRELPGYGPGPMAPQSGPIAPVGGPVAPPATTPPAVAQNPSGDSPSQPETGGAPPDPNAPLAVRNNNPGNLRFVGQNGASKGDGGFAKFDSPEAGAAAMGNQLLTYASRDGLNTVAGIVNKWAPPNENNTSGYIKTVSAALGVDPTAPLDLKDPKVLAGLMTEMNKMEAGPKAALPPGVILAGAASAITGKPPIATMAPTPGASPAQVNSWLPTAPGSAPPSGQLPGYGASGLQGMDPSLLKAAPGDKWLALASGLLQGKTFGAGLGKGLENMNALSQTDRTNQLHIATLNNQTANLQRMYGNTNSMINTRAQQQVRADGAQTYREMSGDQRLALQAQIVGLRANGDERAAQALQDKIGGGASVRPANVKDATAYGTVAEKAITARDAATQLVGLIDSGNVTSNGPSLEDRMKRFVTNLTGTTLDADTSKASGQALFEKLAAQLGNSAALQSTGGQMPRANAEFQTFLKGAANGNMNLDALRALANKMSAESSAVIDGYDKFNSDPDLQSTALHSLGGVKAYQNRVMEAFHQKSGGFAPANPGNGTSSGAYQYQGSIPNPGGGKPLTFTVN